MILGSSNFTIHSNKRDDFRYPDLLAVASAMGIKQAKEIIDHVTFIVSKWPEYARTAEVKQEHLKQIFENLLLLK